ncbi:hypothetical protein WR25_20402 [Diploscapter pachys]|uniref:Uncharacterized protein n=1 Tax=Diploscapter pachys TaxID=2018661 RepID=A0A2A2JLU5_9BILA|nr:hypothetical protein WR25_20402 [Diploscapter pachys]
MTAAVTAHRHSSVDICALLDGVDSKEAAGCWPGKRVPRARESSRLCSEHLPKRAIAKRGKSSGLAVTPRRQIEQLEMSR